MKIDYIKLTEEIQQASKEINRWSTEKQTSADLCRELVNLQTAAHELGVIIETFLYG